MRSSRWSTRPTCTRSSIAFPGLRGTHTIKIGADLRNYRLTSTNSANSRGAFSFNGIYTGNAFADYLTGYPTSGSRSFPRNLFGLTENRYHFYVQDDWKVARNLTVNLGLRYELNLQPVAMFGQSANFNFGTGRWAASTYNGEINTISQQVAQYALPRYRNLVDKATDLGLPNNLRYNNFKDFAPRIGLAWRPFDDNKTVIRSGAGSLLSAHKWQQCGERSDHQRAVHCGRIEAAAHSQRTSRRLPCAELLCNLSVPLRALPRR